MTTTLIPTWTLGSLELTSYPFAVEFGGDHGAPETVTELVTSMLADGDLARRTREGNREISIVVVVEGVSLGELAENEALLRAECTRVSNTLAFNPGDFDSPVSVFEVQVAQMRQPRDEVQEAHLMRRWELTLACAPFARSADPVTVPALTTGTLTVTVDTCDSATGWTGTRDGVPTTTEGPTTLWEAGSVGVMELSDTVGYPPETWTMTRTGSVDFSTTRFLEAELTTLTAKGGGPLKVGAYLNGSSTALPIVQSQLISDGSQYHKVMFDTNGALASSITFRHTSDKGYGHAWQGLQVRNLARTNAAPAVTPRQLSRIIAVGGTERTPAALHLSSADGILPLTDMVVHTSPEDGSGYSPPLRRWRTAGQTPTIADTAFSGAYEVITGAGVQFDVPTSSLPEGGYVLAAYMRTPTPDLATIAWSASTIFPGGVVEEGFTLGQERFTFPDDGWHFVPLAVLSLPTVRTKAGLVRIIIQVPTGITVWLDEAWLFRDEADCALTIVRAPLPHLWLNSADGSSPVPTVWVGDGATTQVHPGSGLVAQGAHVLSPNGTAVFTAALTDNPKTEATFYRRWHSNAAS